jgi:hypothetical protein
VLHQYPKLIAAKPRYGVPLPNPLPENARELTQQLIADQVTTRIIDDFELIQIQIAKDMGRLIGVSALQDAVQAPLELASINQVRECVVRRLVREPLGQVRRSSDLSLQLSVYRFKGCRTLSNPTFQLVFESF